MNPWHCTLLAPPSFGYRECARRRRVFAAGSGRFVGRRPGCRWFVVGCRSGCLSGCLLLFVVVFVVWASGRATGSGFVTATDELAGTGERNALV